MVERDKISHTHIVFSMAILIMVGPPPSSLIPWLDFFGMFYVCSLVPRMCPLCFFPL